MSINESTVELAALEWFGEQSRVAPTLIPAFSQGEKESVGHGPHLAPSEAAAERQSFGEVVLAGRLREAIRRLKPAIPEEARAAIKRYLKTRFERRVNP